MADIREYLEEEIVNLCDERSKFDEKTVKEQVQHDKNLVGMFDAYTDLVKFEVESESERRRLEFEKEKMTAEIDQKKDEIKKRTMVDWVKTGLYGLGTGAGVVLALLARRDEREGFISDDKIPFFDKFRRDKL